MDHQALAQLLGNYGEFVGAVAVVVTLAYLAAQIRFNTRATQAASLQMASALDQEFLLHVGNDPETSRLWATYLRSPELLSDEERLQGGYLFAAVIRRLENIYLQNQLGTISEEGWQSRQNLFLGMATSPGYSTFLKGPTVPLAYPEFLGYMNRLRSSHE